ncbi:response regulator [Agathobaculum sp. NTUH-O15-33]|uniref:response regulator n=1 Tax=Agathobaculum sp. NTUH-O15-33 TaxID=3079302 RepID=UPI0029586BE5|nr:response regulator [Agathobaculum sp. NTUH-O15-33]WNX84778.1 response regulator [Agathobaculum sp. NTUH-O15-33]
MSDKVMIVDDALFMRAMLRKTLSAAEGLEILEAPDGPTAVRLYQSERPGLVLLDISMPGMSGIDVLRQIRSIDRLARVVMCSAIGQDSMMMEAISGGAVDFIVKPFKPEQILRAVQAAFPHRQGKEGHP